MHNKTRTRQGRDGTRQGKANKKTKQKDKTKQEKTGQDRTAQHSTGKDKTRQDKTKQDKTRQDKTRPTKYPIKELLDELEIRNKTPIRNL